MKPSEPMPALIETVTNTIRQSMESFASKEPSCNSQDLTSTLVSEVTQALQNAIFEGARAGLTEFIETFEREDETVERNGLTYKFKSAQTKPFLTIFGEIRPKRRRYCHWKGGPSIVPLDDAWQMQSRYATPEVTELLLLASSMLTPSETAQLVGRMGAFQPSASLIQDLVNEDGAIINELLSLHEHASKMRPPTEIEEGQTPTAMAVSMDGVNVLVREKGNKPGRPAERPGKEHDPAKSSSYKNAMVGSISRYKQLDNVINIETGEDARLPERISSTYHARMPEPRAQTFKSEFEHQVAQELDQLPKSVTKVLLMDGARGLWNYAENTELFADFKMLIDFFHASEHLSALGEALFGKSSSQADDWYDRWRHKLKYEAGAVDGLLRSSARYAASLSKARRKQVEKEETYFKRNRDKMNYHEFVAEGLPIGSGPVEAACKTIVKARLCQSGMRWSKAGGQNILNLRALHRSGYWDAAWAHYRSVGGFHFNGQSEELRAA